MTDAGVQALAERCPSLESGNLMCCSKVTDAGVQALAKHYPSPVSGNLMCCSEVTDAGPGEALPGPRVGESVVVCARTESVH